jgi:hypothetical protein
MATIDRFSRPRRTRRSRDWWRRFIEEWPRSGRTQAAYCREHGVALGSFCWWRSRFRSKTSPSFLPVTIVPPRASSPPSAPSPLEVVLRSGHLVRIREGFDAALLREVVIALEGEERPC